MAELSIPRCFRVLDVLSAGVVGERPSSFRLATLGCLGSLLLSGCGLPLVKYGDATDRMNHTLERAAAERKTDKPAMNSALMPPLQVEEPKLKSDAETRFDLSVVGAPAGQVFMALVTGTRYSMLLPPDISGTITVKLKDVTIKEALDTIRELYGYEYKIQGSRIFIQTNTLQSRVYQINYLVGRRQGSSDLRVSSSTLANAPSVGGSSSSSGSTTSGSSSSGSGTTSGSTSGTSGQTGAAGNRAGESSRISTSSDADFWRDLNTALTSIVGKEEGRSVIVNAMSGVVVVRALPAELRNVDSYLKATQLVVERQVMLEAKIVAVTLNNSTQSGINWSVFNSVSNGRGMFGVLGPNATLNTTGAIASGAALQITPGKSGKAETSSMNNGFIGLALQTANFSALLSFLETQGDVTVLSSPRIATINNQKAILKVGTDDMYVVNVSGGTAGTSNVASTAPTIDLKPFFSGISLDVTPQIDDEGNVILHVHPAVSEVTEVQKTIDLGANGGIFKLPLPSIGINESDSIVRVQDGNIVAIGGLMKQQQAQDRSQLPGMGEWPLGFLFGQRNSSSSKTEMVILIKPTIINGDKPWQEDLQQVKERVQDYDVRKLSPPWKPTAPAFPLDGR